MKTKFLLGVAIALMMSAQSASASLLMILNDLSTSGIDVVVLDEVGIAGVASVSGAYTSTVGETGIGFGITGFMKYEGSVGGFTVVATTGTSSTTPNSITLDAVTVSSISGGAVDIILIDTGFVDNGSAFLSNFNILAGGVGSMVAQSAVDSANGEGVYAGDGSGSTVTWGGTVLETESLFAGDAFSEYAANAVAGSSAYSMALAMRVTHSGSGITQFSSSLFQVPEPGAIAIWGLFAGFGLIGVRRRKVA